MLCHLRTPTQASSVEIASNLLRLRDQEAEDRRREEAALFIQKLYRLRSSGAVPLQQSLGPSARRPSLINQRRNDVMRQRSIQHYVRRTQHTRPQARRERPRSESHGPFTPVAALSPVAIVEPVGDRPGLRWLNQNVARVEAEEEAEGCKSFVL